MQYRADISVFSPDEKLQAVVEVKGLTHKGPEWAAQLRRNLLAHSVVPVAPYFVLAMSDHIYVWKNSADLTQRLPDVELRTAEVLGRFFSAMENSLAQAGDSALELSMVALLEDLAKDEPSVVRESWAQELAKTGLLDAIRHGEVKVQAAA